MGKTIVLGPAKSFGKGMLCGAAKCKLQRPSKGWMRDLFQALQQTRYQTLGSLNRFVCFHDLL